jgi:hypothetical protein
MNINKAKENYNSVSPRLKRMSYESGEELNLIDFYLKRFIEAVAEDWGHEIFGIYSACNCETDIKDNIEPMLFFYDKKILMTKDGKLYSAKEETFETGGKIWNPEQDGDEYMSEIGTRYINCKYIDTVESMKNIDHDNITAEEMEKLACKTFIAIYQ